MKVGTVPIRLAIGVATSATMERDVKMPETEKPSALVQKIAAAITTAGVNWFDRAAISS